MMLEYDFCCLHVIYVFIPYWYEYPFSMCLKLQNFIICKKTILVFYFISSVENMFLLLRWCSSSALALTSRFQGKSSPLDFKSCSSHFSDTASIKKQFNGAEMKELTQTHHKLTILAVLSSPVRFRGLL